MAHVKRSYAATETVVQWALGTRPNGKYLFTAHLDGPPQDISMDLTENRENARMFLSERQAREFLVLKVPKDLAGKLRVIRVSRMTRESMDDRT